MSQAPSIVLISRKGAGIGGMQQYSADLYTALQQAGVSVQFITLRHWWLLPVWLVKVCTLRQVTHLHFLDAALSPLAFALKRRYPSAKFLLTAHGLDVLYPAPWYQKMLQKTLSVFDIYIAVSEATAELLLGYGIHRNTVTVLCPGVWPTTSTGHPSGIKLITVGRLIKRKGIAWFIEQVLPVVLQKFPNTEYHIVGTGPEKQHVQTMVKDKQLETHVVLHGQLTAKERDVLLLQSSIAIQPNIAVVGDMEGFGISCIEASRIGVPVLAANIEGLKDSVIDGKTGYHFPAGDADSCFQVLERMITDPLSSEKIMRATEQQFSWPTIASQYLHDIYI